MKQKITVYLVVEKGRPILINRLLLYDRLDFAEDVAKSYNYGKKGKRYAVKKGVLVV